MKANIFTYSIELKNKICRLAARLLGNEEDAKDVAQDVFEKVWKKQTKLQNVQNMDAISLKMAKDMCFDRIRHQQVVRKHAQHTKHTSDIRSKAPNYAVKDLAQLAKNLIQELPEKQKVVIHLRDVEELDYKEIAKITELSVTAVRMNLSRARKSIREKMQKIINHGL